MDAPRLILFALAAYTLVGLAFALWFCLKGVDRLDPAARGGTLGFRLLILPGACALWPVLIERTRRAPPPPEGEPHE